MDRVINRVEDELNKWLAREKRLSKLFSFDVSRNKGILREKLNYYNRVAARFKGTRNLDERLALRMLRYERNRMEKLLYPNLLNRLLRRLLVAPVSERIVVRQDGRRVEQNSRALHHSVQLAGFPDLSGKIRDNIGQGVPQFTIPVLQWINENESVDYRLSFSKTGMGDYRFDGYKIALNKDGNENRQQYFSIHQGYKIDSMEAFNLLSGRSVLKSDTWLQLDFNDRDVQGNFRLKQFRSQDVFDLEKSLRQLPLKKRLDKMIKDSLIKSLQKGDRVLVNFIKGRLDRQFYIEANPSLRSFNIYDEHFRKITLQTALDNRSKQAVQAVQKKRERHQNKVSKKAGLQAGS